MFGFYTSAQFAPAFDEASESGPLFRDGDSSGLPTTPKNMGSKDKDEAAESIGGCLGCLCGIAFCVPAFVIYAFYEISMAVASDIARWFRTKTMRTQLLLSFGLLVSLVVGVFIGIWAGSVFLLRDTLIQKSKKFLVEQISLIASRFTSEVWS